MKATSLVLGDWVYDSVLKGPARVTRLREGLICTEFNVKYHDESTFESIPLTKAILEFNGFVRHAFGYSLGHFKLFGNLDENDQVYFTVELNGTPYRVNFVHELQHILKQCNIDKVISLPDALV